MEVNSISSMADIRALWKSETAHKLEDSPGPLTVRSINDLNAVIIKNLHHFSGRFDYVVGIPRSGLLPASILALHLNIELLTFEGLLRRDFRNEYSARGKIKRLNKEMSPRLRALIVDDSINSGSALHRIRQRLEDADLNDIDFEFLAIYAGSTGAPKVNYFLEKIEHPRLFEWNLMHHAYSQNFLCDLDGILCFDGPPEHSNDGGKYLSYIKDAKLKVRPLFALGGIVTSRLSKYRSITEDWLARNEIRYKQLIMLDLDSAERRRELAIHAKYKADVYSALGGTLFIESEEWQARAIAKASKRPVYWFDRAMLISG